jgi:hypothetical protein
VPSLPEELIEAVKAKPGQTDRELTNGLRGRAAPQQPINIAARRLAEKKLIVRRKRPEDGLVGNYPGDAPIPDVKLVARATPNHDVEALSEDELKNDLERWLSLAGWESQIAWGKARGIDIDAKRGTERWIIEVKGPGSRQPMRVNYFIGILGETLQRMADPNAAYSIALPDLAQYRGLWERLPALAKARTKISLLLVSVNGEIQHLK